TAIAAAKEYLGETVRHLDVEDSGNSENSLDRANASSSSREGNIDSGLKIEAQPPDKDPHVIDSLSGGEKSLTAIAFVFALQEYNPSPFYVMDEIDAALDAKNSKRLSELLKDYSEDYQLIVISHNNETVRHADRAYGVSMQEGVSQVRSVELESN
ncbi:MAG: AAA family ATPase, partial [Candidatus Nanohaloarchaea archaeon]|nr:AAA family ATPase [Candidatus Nanohaloarchaea archaeon]